MAEYEAFKPIPMAVGKVGKAFEPTVIGNALMPGDRIKVSFEGTVLERNGKALVQTEFGDIWMLPRSATIEKIS